jgi:autotransporter adhesin
VRQLQAVQASGVGYATNTDGSPNFQQVVLGAGHAPTGTVTSNVAPGIAASDAVNVQQLNAGVIAGVGQSNAYTDGRVGQSQGNLARVAERAYAGVLRQWRLKVHLM